VTDPVRLPETQHSANPFDKVPARRSVDELFTSKENALVLYTGQADLKASIVITTSSLVLTIVATRWDVDELRPGLGAVAIASLIALLIAITVVIPKFRLPVRNEVRTHFSDDENPLFFGHYASMPREEWVAMIADLAADDARLYQMQARDIHAQGKYLVEKKYKHLRLSYVFLGAGFVAGTVAQVIASLT
jgi:hypothetical protein